MKKILLFVALIYLIQSVFAQNGDNTIVNTLPDYIPASPDAASIIKAQQIGINYSSGSPNINIPLGNLNIRDFNLPITLSYNSTGVKWMTMLL